MYLKKILLIMTLFFTAVSFSQLKTKKEELIDSRKKRQREIDSFVKLDYLSKKYKYLDNNFRIKIDDSTFKKAIKKYKYIPERINTYRDSLSVILTYELNSFHGSRIGVSRITYEWKKIGYYIWENSKQSKIIANSLGFTHPYRFYEFLVNDTIKSPQKQEILTLLQKKLSKKIKDTISIKPNKPFLKLAFKNNPTRIKDMEAYLRFKRKLKN